MSEDVYYYLRDRYDAPRITVCLVKDAGGNIGRGMAICSLSEPIVKAEGRDKAFKRALKAIKSRKTQLPIYRDEVLEIFECYGIDLQALPSEDWKSEYNPDLTEYEVFLLSKHKDRVKTIKIEVK